MATKFNYWKAYLQATAQPRPPTCLGPRTTAPGPMQKPRLAKRPCRLQDTRSSDTMHTRVFRLSVFWSESVRTPEKVEGPQGSLIEAHVHDEELWRSGR